MSAVDRLAAALADRYRIERELGHGGMATVYLAEDLKHHRKVAVKVLKPELAAVLGAERFVQEITTTAALQHPHILPLFDSGAARLSHPERSEGSPEFLYYVMPYIEGETLRDKLTRETQLGIDEAVKITVAVADALDYAHRHGVIHRDIKPENILLHDGRPMVADFGIALALSAAAGGRMTETGLSLGTPHYMSPEQATAKKELTARSDIYSLGSVLYEMLTGNPPHVGASAQQIIMMIVTEEAQPVTRLRKSVPPNVAAAVAKSLEKLPADRFASAAAFAEALTNPAFRTATGAAAAGPAAQAPSRLTVPLAGIAILATALAAWGWLVRPARDGPAPKVIRFTVPVVQGHVMSHFMNILPNLAISPDGRTLAYIANAVLYKRVLDRDEPERLGVVPGGSCCPTFSRDGQWILVDPGGQGLTKAISVDGGSVVDVSTRLRGEDLVYANPIHNQEILRHRAGDTAWTPITTLDSAGREGAHVWPQLLPGGGHLLFTILSPGMMWNGASVVVEDLATGARTTVAEQATYGRYVTSGHIVYTDAEGTLEAVPFDVEGHQATGRPFVVATGIRTANSLGAADFAISDNGTLAYVRGSTWVAHQLTWLDRAGKVVGRVGEPATLDPLNLSPDGRYVAMNVASPNADIFRIDVVSGERRRLTFDETTEDAPVWSPDGRRIAYHKVVSGRDHRIYAMEVDGRGDPQLLYSSDHALFAQDWAPDGRSLTFTGGGARIIVNIENGKVDTVTAHGGGDAQFSPDGRWLAYESRETGDVEVYVTSFPALSGKQQVSVRGGNRPQWAARSGELFFTDGDTVMVSRVSTGAAFSHSIPRPLFVAPDRGMAANGFVVSADGQRFLYAAPNPDAAAKEIHVVLNWFEELKAKGRK